MACSRHRCTNLCSGVGITLSTNGPGSGAVSSSGRAMINSEEFLKFLAEQHEFVHQWINLCSHCSPRQGEVVGS